MDLRKSLDIPEFAYDMVLIREICPGLYIFINLTID
jgi:hypothetical protein